MRTLRASIAGAILLAAAFVGAGPAEAVSNPDDHTAQLPSGHCLQTSASYPSAELDSVNGRFNFWMWYQGQLDLENTADAGNVGGHSYVIWSPVHLPDPPSATSALCMQTNGDLVMHQGTHFAWHTGTATVAAGGYARLLDTGRLVVRNKAGTTVWSSSTTAVLLMAGDRLPSGQLLVNRTYPGSTTILDMSSSGDLVLRRNSTTVWHSNTHSPGSYMWITSTGRMAISTAAGTPIWNTRAVGTYPVLTVAQQGRLTLQRIPPGPNCIVLPANANPDCGRG